MTKINVEDIENHIGKTLSIKRISDGKEKSIKIDSVKGNVVFQFDGEVNFSGYDLRVVKNNPNNFILTVYA